MRKNIIVGLVAAGIAVAGAGAAVASVKDDTSSTNVPKPAKTVTTQVDRTDTTEENGVNIGNDACVAPWHWDGPLNGSNRDKDTNYTACNDYDRDHTERNGVNILNDACVLPWLWDGPLNGPSDDNETNYAACNDYR